MKLRHLKKLYGAGFGAALSVYGRARAEGTATMPMLYDAWDSTLYSWVRILPLARVGALGDVLAFDEEWRPPVGPWPYDAAAAHLLRQSETDPAQVAYLSSPAKLMRILPDTHPTKPGQRDALYTRTTPGRALKALCPEMSDEDIKAAANAWLAKVRGGDFAVHILDNNAEQWADDAAGLQREWFRLYDSIQVDYSCMRGSHGVKAYGLPGNGLGLAYLTDGNGAAMVRTIIHRRNGETRFSRVFPFGDMSLEKARAFFSAQGWTESQDLDGFMLALVRHPLGGWCCPYIDGDTQRVSEFSDHLLIESAGDHEATNTNGRWDEDEDEPYCTCDICGADTSEEDAFWIESEDRTVCVNCIDRHYVRAYINRHDQDYVHEEEALYCAGTGEYYDSLDTAARHDVYPCEIDGDLYELDDLVMTSRGFIHHDAACVVLLHRDDPDGYGYAHYGDTTTITHPNTNESRTYHEDDEDGIAEWEAEIEADKAEAEAEEAEEVAA